MRVLDSAREAAGEVKDLALDWNSERIPFVIVAPSGVLKLAAVWYPVPSSALKMTNGKSLALTMTSDRFVAAPQFHPGEDAHHMAERRPGLDFEHPADVIESPAVDA